MHDKKPSPGGRWRGAAMTDEGDHGGASVIDGMTGHDGSCRGGPLCPPVDDHRANDTHPHPVPSGPSSPWEGEG